MWVAVSGGRQGSVCCRRQQQRGRLQCLCHTAPPGAGGGGRARLARPARATRRAASQAVRGYDGCRCGSTFWAGGAEQAALLNKWFAVSSKTGASRGACNSGTICHPLYCLHAGRSGWAAPAAVDTMAARQQRQQVQQVQQQRAAPMRQEWSCRCDLGEGGCDPADQCCVPFKTCFAHIAKTAVLLPHTSCGPPRAAQPPVVANGTRRHGTPASACLQSLSQRWSPLLRPSRRTATPRPPWTWPQVCDCCSKHTLAPRMRSAAARTMAEEGSEERSGLLHGQRAWQG